MKKFRLYISAVCCIACLLTIHAFAATGFIAYNQGDNANDGLTAATAKKQFLSGEIPFFYYTKNPAALQQQE